MLLPFVSDHIGLINAWFRQCCISKQTINKQANKQTGRQTIWSLNIGHTTCFAGLLLDISAAMVGDCNTTYFISNGQQCQRAMIKNLQTKPNTNCRQVKLCSQLDHSTTLSLNKSFRKKGIPCFYRVKETRIEAQAFQTHDWRSRSSIYVRVST